MAEHLHAKRRKLFGKDSAVQASWPGRPTMSASEEGVMQRVLRAAADEKGLSQIVMMDGQPVQFNQLEANAAALVAGGSELHTAVLAAVQKDKQVHQVHLWMCAHYVGYYN